MAQAKENLFATMSQVMSSPGFLHILYVTNKEFFSDEQQTFVLFRELFDPYYKDGKIPSLPAHSFCLKKFLMTL